MTTEERDYQDGKHGGHVFTCDDCGEAKKVVMIMNDVPNKVIKQKIFQPSLDGLISTVDPFSEPNISHPTTAKDLCLVVISCDTSMSLVRLWHSRLPNTEKGNLLRNTHSIFFGFACGNNYYATAMWTTPVAANRLKNGFQALELRRLAICSNAPKFTASRMLSLMVKHIRTVLPEILYLISYQDTEVHTGTIYKASNWILDNVQNEGQSWTTERRKRGLEQSKAPKNRWLYVLRPVG